MKINNAISTVVSCGLALLVTSLTDIQASVVSAGEKDDLGFSMPCAQVLKLGRDKFEDVYTSRTHNSSTLGMNHGYDYYMNCRRADNERRARRLTAGQRQQIKTIHEALSHLNVALYNIESECAGGGTIYRVFATANAAGHEDLVGAVIAALSHPAHSNPIHRRRVVQRFAQAQATLISLSAPPAQGDPEYSSVEQKRIYANAVSEARQALKNLRAVALKMPAAVAWRIVNQLQAEIKNAGTDN